LHFEVTAKLKKTFAAITDIR